MARAPTARLGPFRLLRPLARGKEGQLWAAIEPGRTEVAVKILSRVRQANQSATEREIRALSALRHPHIIRVYEQGLVSATEEQLSGGHLLRGQPWFAMELAAGSLDHRDSPMGWTELHGVLRQILGALAHAHARSVLHLDLKPSNLLRLGDRILLADFGIALERFELAHRTQRRPRGSPAYMAPEQLRSEWGAFGPWTDLYALGRVIWKLTTGSTGIDPSSSLQEVWDQTQAPSDPPPLPEDYPRGLGDVLCALLAPDPETRFQRAADLRWALEQVDAQAVPIWPPRAPVPLDWRLPRDEMGVEPIAREVPGLGLSLHGLRNIPFFGREPQRDRLWSTLRTVIDTARPAAVCLRAPSGLGKSRLAQWLGERAHELGAAELARARFGPQPGAGLEPMLEELLARPLENALPEEEGAALGVIARLLIDAAARHPLIVWLDDVQWGVRGLSVAQRLLELGRGRVLIVLTVREEGLSDRPEEAARLDQLQEGGMTTLDLGPLSNEAGVRLLHEGLHLSWELVDSLWPRVEGNPLFAIHLVDDWVARDVLHPTPDGFRLHPGSPTPLPEGLDRLWQARIAEVCASTADPTATQAALERAACLGTDVHRRTWEVTVCDSVDLAAIEWHLVRARLASATPTGWRFHHGMVREALISGARRTGRLPGHHRACADALRSGPGTPPPERLAWHLLGAGEADSAADLLLESFHEHWAGGRRAGQYAPLEAMSRALSQLGADAEDPRKAWHLYYLARVQSELVSAKAGQALLDQARAAAKVSGNDTVLRLVRDQESVLAAYAGDYDKAMAIKRELMNLWADDEDWERWALGQTAIAQWLARRGDLDDARDALRQLDEVLPLCKETLRPRVAIIRILVHVARGELDEARVVGRGALALAGSSGHASTQATLWNNLGEAERLSGDLEAAMTCYGEAERLYREAGLPGEAIPALNRAHVESEIGLFESADRRLERAAGTLERAGRRLPRLVADLARLRCLHRLGQLETWEEVFARCEAMLERVGVRNHNVIDTLGEALEAAEELGDRPRAARLRRMLERTVG